MSFPPGQRAEAFGISIIFNAALRPMLTDVMDAYAS